MGLLFSFMVGIFRFSLKFLLELVILPIFILQVGRVIFIGGILELVRSLVSCLLCGCLFELRLTVFDLAFFFYNSNSVLGLRRVRALRCGQQPDLGVRHCCSVFERADLGLASAG